MTACREKALKAVFLFLDNTMSTTTTTTTMTGLPKTRNVPIPKSESDHPKKFRTSKPRDAAIVLMPYISVGSEC